MPLWLTEQEMRVLGAVVDRLLPGEDAAGDSGDSDVFVGALAAGAADYIDGLLGAFLVDPPRIWAGGPTSGRFGGEAGYRAFHRLSPLDELAWRTRIEGSRGVAEREFNGPVVGYQQIYREGLAALGDDFCEVTAEERDTRLRLRDNRRFTTLAFQHCCEAAYGPPEYGGNRNLCGWRSIGFAGDVQPRGWTDAEVAEP
jgi:Gluconate 2-dehydrogenase subunit 3